MKVIDEQPFNYEFECRARKSRLQAEAADVKVGFFGANYGGDTPVRGYYVTCVVCGADHELPRERVHRNVRERADREYDAEHPER